MGWPEPRGGPAGTWVPPTQYPGRAHGRGGSGQSGAHSWGHWTGLHPGSWGGPCRSFAAPQGLFGDPIAPNPQGLSRGRQKAGRSRLVSRPREAAVLMPQAHLGCPAVQPGHGAGQDHAAGGPRAPLISSAAPTMPCRTLTPPCPLCGPDHTTGPRLSRTQPSGPPREGRERPSEHTARAQGAGVRCRPSAPQDPARASVPEPLTDDHLCWLQSRHVYSPNGSASQHANVGLTGPASGAGASGWEPGLHAPRAPCCPRRPASPRSSTPALRRPASPSCLLASRLSEENAPPSVGKPPPPQTPRQATGVFSLIPEF